VPGRIEAELDVIVDGRIQPEVAEVELGGVERRGQIEIAVRREHLQMRIAAHRCRQVAADVGSLGEAVFLFAFPVPTTIDHTVVVGKIGAFLGELQFAGGVLVERGEVGAGGRVAGRITFRRLTGSVRIDPLETAVQTANSAVLVAQKFLAETTGVDAQVRFLDVGR